jgi:hypothetical protein
MRALAFSKKLENLVTLHQTLRVTPTMEAGIFDHLWSLDDCFIGPKEIPWRLITRLETSRP